MATLSNRREAAIGIYLNLHLMKHLARIILSTALLALSFASFGQKGGGSTNSPNQIGCNLFVPNAFTPNGDGINDKFVLKTGDNCEYQEFSMKIFDRWGRLVYSSDSPSPERAWDGTFDGQELGQGVYIWDLQAKMVSLNDPTADPIPVNRQSTLVLIR